jgi:MioC protein
MAADDMAALLNDAGLPARVVPMEDANVESLAQDDVVIVITSTYADGELPETTQPFHAALLAGRPDLSRLRFAAFGLGGSTCETKGNGIDRVTALLRDLGARQFGATGRHDAARSLPLTSAVLDWGNGIMPELAAVAC